VAKREALKCDHRGRRVAKIEECVAKLEGWLAKFRDGWLSLEGWVANLKGWSAK
jgi:hypothetical protein